MANILNGSGGDGSYGFCHFYEAAKARIAYSPPCTNKDVMNTEKQQTGKYERKKTK